MYNVDEIYHCLESIMQFYSVIDDFYLFNDGFVDKQI